MITLQHVPGLLLPQYCDEPRSYQGLRLAYYHMCHRFETNLKISSFKVSYSFEYLSNASFGRAGGWGARLFQYAWLKCWIIGVNDGNLQRSNKLFLYLEYNFLPILLCHFSHPPGLRSPNRSAVIVLSSVIQKAVIMSNNLRYQITLGFLFSKLNMLFCLFICVSLPIMTFATPLPQFADDFNDMASSQFVAESNPDCTTHANDFLDETTQTVRRQPSAKVCPVMKSGTGSTIAIPKNTQREPAHQRPTFTENHNPCDNEELYPGTRIHYTCGGPIALSRTKNIIFNCEPGKSLNWFCNGSCNEFHLHKFSFDPDTAGGLTILSVGSCPYIQARGPFKRVDRVSEVCCRFPSSGVSSDAPWIMIGHWSIKPDFYAAGGCTVIPGAPGFDSWPDAEYSKLIRDSGIEAWWIIEAGRNNVGIFSTCEMGFYGVKK